MDWRKNIERNGEVSIIVVADSLGMSDNDVLAFANKHHGARFVGGTSVYLIWKEDAEEIERLLNQSRRAT